MTTTYFEVFRGRDHRNPDDNGQQDCGVFQGERDGVVIAFIAHANGPKR